MKPSHEIDDLVDFEAGGTLAGVFFSWIRNSLVVLVALGLGIV